MKVNRVVTVVLDSAGVGYMPDAGRFKDDETNTLLHVFEQRGKLEIPNLCALGMGQIVDIPCGPNDVIGCYGKMGERSPNKDTTSGHWELAGLVVDSPFPTYPDGFPQDLIETFEKKIGTKTLGNYPSSGTEILKELGEEAIADLSNLQFFSLNKNQLSEEKMHQLREALPKVEFDLN